MLGTLGIMHIISRVTAMGDQRCLTAGLQLVMDVFLENPSQKTTLLCCSALWRPPTTGVAGLSSMTAVILLMCVADNDG